MPESEYRVDRDGKRVVMSYDVFKKASFKEICKMLKIPTEK